jgi:hypothetical protein
LDRSRPVQFGDPIGVMAVFILIQGLKTIPDPIKHIYHIPQDGSQFRSMGHAA